MTLPTNVSIPDVLQTLARPEHYVRGILEILHECRREHGNATVRIGVTGDGIAPHYRIDFRMPENVLGIANGIFGAFDGRSHKLIRWIDDSSQEDGSVLQANHWSTRSMTIDEVATYLGQIRGFKKNSPTGSRA